MTRKIAAEFPQLPDIQYFNHAAMGPWPLRTRQAVAEFAGHCGTDLLKHWPKWYAKEKALRETLGRLIGAPEGGSNISMTKNTSEGLSLIAAGLDWEDGDQVLTLAEEFSSNRWSWQECTPPSVQVVEVPRACHQPPHEALIQHCAANTRLIAVSTVQYVCGTALNLAALSEYCQANSILLVIDVIQSLGALPLDITSTPVDAVACGSHKWLMAAEGLGLLYTSETLRHALRPRQAGWRMVPDPFQFPASASARATDGRGLEAGTLNTLGMMALSASVSLYEEVGANEVLRRIQRNTACLISAAKNLGLPLATPDDPAQQSGIVSLRHRDGEKTANLLNRLSAAGAVCTMRGGYLRISPHYSTPLEHVENLCQLISENL
ncbi:MAG: aminotransferase class V-fold PLP-dependent enzyme [Lysobacterales bacterium]